MAVSLSLANSENITKNSCLSEQMILKHIKTPEGSKCKIVAKQKIFDGNYRIYYIKSLPDGTTEVESINLLQVDPEKWVVSEPRVLPTS